MLTFVQYTRPYQEELKTVLTRSSELTRTSELMRTSELARTSELTRTSELVVVEELESKSRSRLPEGLLKYATIQENLLEFTQVE
jgi:hypothetical protein